MTKLRPTLIYFDTLLLYRYQAVMQVDRNLTQKLPIDVATLHTMKVFDVHVCIY